MRKCLLTALIAAVASPAVWAAAKCVPHPREQWIKQAEFRQRLEQAGYRLKSFKVDGNCYQLDGKNRAGRNVEIYFDTVTGAAVKSEVED